MDTAINGCVEMSKEIIQDKIQDNLFRKSQTIKKRETN